MRDDYWIHMSGVIVGGYMLRHAIEWIKNHLRARKERKSSIAE